jgi:hypothetical protein
MPTKTIDGVIYREDRHGSLVMECMIKEIDKLRDDLVMDIVKKSKELSALLADFKTKTTNDITAFVQLSAEKYSVAFGGEKGNINLVSYDGEYKVSKAINEYIVFDERLQIAKTLIDDCIKDWSTESKDELKALINHAFRVDKAGNISIDGVLGLRRIAIDDHRWKKAMEAISDSIQITGSKAYIRVYRKNKDKKYELINLDLAAI